MKVLRLVVLGLMCVWLWVACGVWGGASAWGQVSKRTSLSQRSTSQSSSAKSRATFALCRPLLPKWKALLDIDRQGEAHSRKKRYKKALALYRWAYALLGKRSKQGKTPLERACAALFWRAYAGRLAVTYHCAKELLQARVFYSTCARESPKPRQKEACQLHLKRVQRQLVQVVFVVRPQTARVSLFRKGKLVRQVVAGKAYWMKPGQWTLRAGQKGYATVYESLSLAAGLRARVSLRLQKSSCGSDGKAPILVGSRFQFALARTIPLALQPTIPTAKEQQPLMEQPWRKGPFWVPWRVALLVGGVTIGAAALGAGAYAIYRANRRIYVWTP